MRYVCTYVITSEMVDIGLRQHGIVLELALAQRRRVTGDDNQLRLAGSQGLEGGFVSESDFSGFHDEGQTGVDSLGILLALLWMGRLDGGLKGGSKSKTH